MSDFEVVTMTDFEKFIHDRGGEFKTEDALRAGFDRQWKSAHGVLLTEGEFVAEAGERYDTEELKKVYAVLVKLVSQKKLTSADVYMYVRFRWCLRGADAIVAYQTEPHKWKVNNCGTKVTDEAALVAVNSEWGFEVSRVKIIGTPYYDATDWQFIRFDCAHMTWLWMNGSLYQVYE